MSFKKSTAVLALLFLGSAGIQAQSSDPFGEINKEGCSKTMTITGYVRMVTDSKSEPTKLGEETVVAVYQGDKLRGKDTPFKSGSYTDILMLTVYGEDDGVPLFFKVYTDGRVIEVDQGLTFTDGRVGAAKDNPYYIDLPAPVITTFTSEGWATTCLPFDAYTPDGVTLWVVTGIEDGEVVIEEVEDVTVLPKNTPVLLKSELSQVEWLSAVIDEKTLEQQTALFDGLASILNGTTEPTAVEANSVLTLGYSAENNVPGFWLFPETEIPANQAYIIDFPTDSDGGLLPTDGGETTDISGVKNRSLLNGKSYDLQGRPVQKGLYNSIYIIDGRKYMNRR